MIDTKTGRVDPSRFGWDNKLTGGALLGSSMSRAITEDLTIDATDGAAYFLGFASGMQYNGLDRGSMAKMAG